MAEITTATVTAIKTDVVAAESKVVAYIKSHATPTVVGTVAGFTVGKFHILGLLAKLI